jgi:prepilin-type N-terminal cleavage/methylation domain-containing protein
MVFKSNTNLKIKRGPTPPKSCMQFSGGRTSKKLGFTFIELIVVIAVIAILTTISFPYYNSIKKNLALERSAAKLVQDIRRAQEMTISGQSPSGVFPKGGYGIYLNKNNTDYVLFKDSDEGKTCNNNCNSSSPEKIETIALDSKIEVGNLDDNKIHLIFLPPDPVVYLTNQSGSDLGVSVTTIRISIIGEPSKYKDIKINRAGLVWIE